MTSTQRYQSFATFYPYYLREHTNIVCRRLHFVGTAGVIVTAIVAVLTQRWWLFLLTPLFGYSFAWAGHFFFEKNRPATFQYPFYSLLGDFAMFRDMLLRRIPF
ncbi:MAG: DUF962 domain-containing protein [Gammaproteobacteria bacterium]|nr:DUF962 domain-containing protein [Gammaproteobacteria bacterium]NND60663.1 DUF962 domain-containing protein [Gammaproteobacteria bacterium]